MSNNMNNMNNMNMNNIMRIQFEYMLNIFQQKIK